MDQIYVPECPESDVTGLDILQVFSLNHQLNEHCMLMHTHCLHQRDGRGGGEGGGGGT